MNQCLRTIDTYIYFLFVEGFCKQNFTLASSAMLRQQAALTRGATSQDSLPDTVEIITLQPRSVRPTKSPPRVPPRPKSARPMIVNVLRKGEDEGGIHPKSGMRPERMASSNVRSLALTSHSSPELDQSLDDLSSYDDSLYAKLTNGHDLSVPSRGTSPLPPPLPLRNSVRQELLLSQSQEMLSGVQSPGSRDELNTLGLAPAPSHGRDLPSLAPWTVKDSRGSKDAPSSGRDKPQRHPRSIDAHGSPWSPGHKSPSALPVVMPKEVSVKAISRFGHRPGSREPLHAGKAESNSLTNSTEGSSHELGTQLFAFENRETLENLSRMVQAGMSSGQPHKAPSISSNSTLYQPADAGHQHYPVQTAFKIAPYTIPGGPAAPLPPPSSPHTSCSSELQPAIVRSNIHAAPRTATQRSGWPGGSAPPHPVLHLTAKGGEKGPHFRDTPQQPSHSRSMYHLDDPMDSAHFPGAPQHRPPPIPTAKSLSSLLESSSSSLRAYGQPTHL